MKLKKPMTVKARPAAAAAAPAAGGGATIADRFKLDVTPAAAAGPVRTVNKTAALIALVAALAGLALSGFLAYTLSDHWEFLKPSTSFTNS